MRLQQLRMDFATGSCEHNTMPACLPGKGGWCNPFGLLLETGANDQDAQPDHPWIGITLCHIEAVDLSETENDTLAMGNAQTPGKSLYLGFFSYWDCFGQHK